MNKPHGWVIWLTGLPASGKSSLARAIRSELRGDGVATVLLDSDELRHVLTPNATYTQSERDQFYGRLMDLAVWLAEEGENVIIAATGSQRSYRDAARARLGQHFAEVWVRCSVAACRSRDEKGLFAGADAGTIRNLPGADAPYEAPDRPEVVVDTERQPPDDGAAAVIAALPFLECVSSSCGAHIHPTPTRGDA